MVTKCQKSDEKYAIFLSREVIKPLLDSHLSGEGWKSLVITYDQSQQRGKYPCVVCSKLFSSKQYVKVHMSKIHIGCQICDKMFLNDIDLKTHRLIAHQQDKMKIPKKQTTKSDVTPEMDPNHLT